MYHNAQINKELINKRRLKIYQIAEGYCYNSDSLFLWDFIIPHIKPRAKILELGSGSGIIGLLCARSKNVALYQIEKQVEYALMNAKNAQINHIDSVIIHADCNMIIQSKDILEELHANMLCNDKKLEAIFTKQQLSKVLADKNLNDLKQNTTDCKNLYSTSLYSKTCNYLNSIDSERFLSKSLTYAQIVGNTLDSTQEHIESKAFFHQSQTLQHADIPSLPYFDMIVSNPPFYHTQTLQSNNPFKAQATQSHFLPFSTILKLAKKVLKPHGKLIFCYAPTMIAEILESLMAFNFGIEALRFVYPRKDKHSTLVLVYARHNSKAQTRILPPLITHNGLAQQDNTEEVISIYNAAYTQSLKVSYDDIVWEDLL